MSDKYSLLIMRDSSEKVRRMRLSVQLIKVLLISFAVLIIVVAGGIAFSIYSIGQYASLTSENSELRANLADANIQLERLQSYEALLKNSEEEARLQMPIDKEAGTPDPSRNQTAEEVNTQEVVASIFPDSVNATVEQTTGIGADASDGDIAYTTNSTEAASASTASSSDSPAKVSNIEIRARSPKSIRLAFDLNNENQGVTLSGNVDLALVTKQNEVLDVTVPRQDMFFQINYYKRMSTAFPLPEGITLADIKSLRLTVKANGKTLQTETYPFPPQD